MKYSLIAFGEVLLELQERIEGLVLDRSNSHGNLDTSVDALLSDGIIQPSGDVLNMVNAAANILNANDCDGKCELVTALGDSTGSTYALERIRFMGLGTQHLPVVEGERMGVYVDGYRDDGGAYPYARKGAAFESLTTDDLMKVLETTEGFDRKAFLTSGIANVRGHDQIDLKAVLERCHDMGFVTFYTENFRSTLWGESEENSYANCREAFREIAPCLDYCFMSLEEAKIALEHDVVPEIAIREIFDLGVNNGVIITGYPLAYAGFKGDVDILQYDAKEGESVNTTGAGDNFLGIFAAVYMITGNVNEAFQKAGHIAEMSTSMKGGLYRPEDMKQFKI